VFVVWGISEFVTDFIGMEGSGKFLVGLFLVILAFILLFRSKSVMPKIKVEKREEEPSSEYR